MRLYLITSKSWPVPSVVSRSLEFHSSTFDLTVNEINGKSLRLFVILVPWKIKLWCLEESPSLLLRMLGNLDISPNSPSAAWNWINALNRIRRPKIKPNLIFSNWLKSQAQNNPKTILVGSGSSAMGWKKLTKDNRILIVANSVIKSKEFLEHHSPDLVVAADALFHFSETRHARRYRESVQEYLSQNPKAFFLFPAHFSQTVFRTISADPKQLVPVPARKYRYGNVFDFMKFGKLPAGKNILDYVMLPVAAAISKEIYLLGFDGKPQIQTQGIWSSPDEFEFANEKDELKADYPGFFKYWDFRNISTDNFGENIRSQINQLIERNYKVRLLAPSLHQSLDAVQIDLDLMQSLDK